MAVSSKCLEVLEVCSMRERGRDFFLLNFFLPIFLSTMA